MTSTPMRKGTLQFEERFLLFIMLVYFWLLVQFIRLRAAVVGVSASLYYKYLITLHVSAELAIIKCTISLIDLLR
jgi:hypothetical protein